MAVVLCSPASAKKPAAADETAIRAMIEKLYAPYSRPIPDAPEDGSAVPENEPGAAIDGYELPYTQTLDALVAKWAGLMQATEELYRLNSFDWFCQCQDYDNATARMVKQSYSQTGKDRISAKIQFSPSQYDGRATGQPLTFMFKREGETWKLDDLKFHDFVTLRKGLADDITDAAKDLAASKQN